MGTVLGEGLMAILGDVDLAFSEFVVEEDVVIVDDDLQDVSLFLEGEGLVEGNVIASFFLGLGFLLLVAEFELDVGVLPKSSGTFLEKESESFWMRADTSRTCSDISIL
jgi:hypothetical protein